MEAKKAHKVQNTNGVKSNRTVPKEDYVKPHSRSKVKSVKDPRLVEVKLLLTHPRKSVQNITVENYAVESKVRYWEGMGYDVKVCN